jgi:hypothetical protein
MRPLLTPRCALRHTLAPPILFASYARASPASRREHTVLHAHPATAQLMTATLTRSRSAMALAHPGFWTTATGEQGRLAVARLIPSYPLVATTTR